VFGFDMGVESWVAEVRFAATTSEISVIAIVFGSALCFLTRFVGLLL